MKKIALITLFIFGLVGNIVTANTSINDTEEQKQDNNKELKRMQKAQVFLNLLEKLKNNEIELNHFIYFTLEWIEELDKSDDQADQELSYQLKQIMINFIAAVQTSDSEETQPENALTNI